MTQPDTPSPDIRSGPKNPLVFISSLVTGTIIPVLIAVLIISGLYLVYLFNYTLFHMTVESVVIVIAASVFLAAWKSRRIVTNGYLLFLGTAFLSFSVITIFHVLAAPGTGIFPNSGNPLSSQFRIAGESLLAVSLLAAPFFIGKKLRSDLLAAAFLAVDILLIGSILMGVFPAAYTEGVGQTDFKIVGEYAISLVMIGAIVLHYRNRASFDRRVVNDLVVAFLLTIATELTLSFMARSTDIFSFGGHIFRLFSFYFFYLAIIMVGAGAAERSPVPRPGGE